MTCSFSDPTSSTSPVPSIRPPYSNTISCSFDRDFCAWSNNGFFNVSTTAHISVEKGDYFAFAPLSSSSPSATLTSPFVAQTQPTQMFFYYFAHRDLEEVTVSAHFVQGVIQPLWRLRATSAPSNFGRWIPVRINLCMSGRFRLILSVTRRYCLSYAVVGKSIL